MSSHGENQEDNILYELQVFSEWTQEPDVIVKPNERSQFWDWKAVSSYLKNTSASIHVNKWINQQLPWLFAVGAEGKAVAILQDTALEIRTLRDNYSVPIGKAFVARDSSPQWRKLEWSPDGSLLAVALSNGSVEVYDLLASQLFVVPSPGGSGISRPSAGVPGNAIAGLSFIDSRTKQAHWSYELLCLDYNGQLNAYYVSPTQGFEPSHSFSFASFLPYGVTALCTDHLKNLIVLASPVMDTSSLESPSIGADQGFAGNKLGLSLWRLLDEQPYYEQAPNSAALSSKRWLNFRKTTYGNTTVKMSLSPDGSSLAAIHLSGAVSILAVPSLIGRHFWPLERQPGFDELSPSLLQLPAQRRVRNPAFQNPFKFHPIDLTWWSADSIILARCSGAVSVCEIADLRNKLGSSAEFFDGSPRVGPAFNNTFLGLECEVKIQRKRLLPSGGESSSIDTPDDEIEESLDEPSEDEGNHLLAHRMVRSLLYWVTDSERFQPPRKRPKLLTKTYRLLGFKRTTPEELYIWKLDAEEYGEALALARAYGLDCDLVYQRQWRNAPATVASIHDYLSKVTKRNWLLRECLERVPNDVDAARELLLYGLKNTDLAVVAGDTGSAESKWSPLELPDSEAEALKKEEEKRRKWLAKIDFNNLTVEQKMLISTRRRLLQYLDRLSLYEMILGGPARAGQHYDPSLFETFRAQSAVESTAKFARQGEWQAVAVMFTFSGAQTLPHRLAICSSFPETLPPFEYRSVLPECDSNGEVFLWEQQSLREADWCECPAAQLAVDVERVLEAEAVELFYSEEKKLKPFHTADVALGTDLVTLWYQMRAADIEKQSMLVDNALDLIKLGLERNVPNLDRIHHQLLTLETLVYDLHHENLDLEKLSSMSDLRVCQLMMSSCDDDSFFPALNRWLMPFLRRLDGLNPGCIANLLRGVLVSRSQDNLGWALQVCEQSKADKANPVIADPEVLISLALDCLYACQQTDQLETAMKIYDCLPERPTGPGVSPELSRLHDRLDQLQLHLEAADILENHEVAMTLSSIAAKQQDDEQAEQIFVRLTRTFMRKAQPPTEGQWREVLQDMLELQKKVFNRISPQLCYEILVGSLLSSSKKESIVSAGQMLQLDPNQQRHKAASGSDIGSRKPVDVAVIPFKRSKQLILQASEEYFNSSENLSDPSLELASYCLGLISVEDEEIQKEKDLISAVQLLYDYGLDMPPLKIRLSRNRLLLIDQVLKHNKKAYKNASRLLRLGNLLRACGSGGHQNELEGQIYVKIAETALSKHDLDVAGQTCNTIRVGNHSVGWNVCASLAKLDHFEDVPLKISLVSFALVYCPVEVVEELLQLQWMLEHHQLRNKCTRQIETYLSYENGNQELLPLMNKSVADTYLETSKKRQTLAAAKENTAERHGGSVRHQMLQTTAETTKSFVNAVKNTLKLHDGEQTSSTASQKPVDDNRDCNRWGLPVFYWNVCFHGGIGLHESCLDVSYRLFSLPESTNSELLLLSLSWRMEVLEGLPQTYALNYSLKEGLVAKLAECLFPEDCLLALGHLLDLKDATKAWEPLTRLPSTEITLQMAAYYFALRILRLMSSPVGVDVIGARPRRLIEHCIKLSEENLSEEQRAYRELLQRSLRLLTDVSEAQQLRRLDAGVDINRFTSDDDYKRDTIVGLAITTDASVYSAAVRLASHYGVSAWEVTFSHLTALFAEDKIEPERMVQYMDEHNMRDTLFCRPDDLGPKMVSIIYPSISGKDHARLSVFFQLMNSHPLLANSMEPAPSVFLKVLEKVESIKGLDVKKLVSSVLDFRREVENALNSDNVGKLAKLAKLIAKSVQGLSPEISEGTVHAIWARKHFFQMKLENASPSPADWFHRFESCKTHVNRLPAEEFLQLVDGLCFSDRALEELSLDVRSEICRRSLKLAETRSGKTKNQSFEDCISRLRSWSDHLDRLKSEEYSKIRLEVISSIGSRFWKLFDQSRAEETALHRLLLLVLLESQPMSVVRSFVSIFPPDFSSTPEDILLDALRFTLAFLRGSEGAATGDECKGDALLGADSDPLGVLLHLLTQVRHVLNEDQGAMGLISQSDVDDMLRHFYDDDAVDINVRLRVLQTLPPGFAASMESGSRVQWFRTLALIHQTWLADDSCGEVTFLRDLKEEELHTPEQRRALFDSLLNLSHNAVRLASIAKLLHFWPPFPVESEPISTPWVMLWKRMVELPSFPRDPLISDSLRLALEQDPSLSDECIQIIYETLGTTSRPATRLRLLVALRSSLQPLLDDVLRFVDTASELSEEDYDPAILDLIIERGLVGRLAGTVLYGPLCERLLSVSDTSIVKNVARQLIDHGHRSEAGHLLQMISGLPRYLLNLPSSLYFARKKV